MALPTLTHRMIAPQPVPATPDMVDLLETIQAALAQGEYYNAAARSAGAGNAWIVEHVELDGSDDPVALLLRPAGGDVQDMRVVLAGVVATDSETPKMIASDAYAAGILMIGVIKQVPEAFDPENDWQGWDHATSPIADAHFTGYARCQAIASTPTAVRVVESAESIWFEFVEADGDCAVSGAGALWDPFTAARGEPANGRRYGLVSSGSGSTVSSSLWSASAGSGSLFMHAVSGGQAKSACFAPGDTATIINPTRPTYGSSQMSATSQVDPTGTVRERLPLYMAEAPHNTTSNWLGRVRQAYIVGDLLSGTIIKVAGNDVAYALGGKSDAACNVVALGA